MKIRIAVAMNDKGEWSSAGWSRATGLVSDKELAVCAMECLNQATNERVSFVEVDIPVPQTPTVQGEVVCSEQLEPS